MLPELLFVADESVDFNLIKFLRSKGLSVFSILEEILSLKDFLVLELAVEKEAVLITEDKDFGELIFKLNLPHKGLLLLRIEKMPLEEKNEIIFQVILKHSASLSQSFAVIKQRKLRIRNIK